MTKTIGLKMVNKITVIYIMFGRTSLSEVVSY